MRLIATLTAAAAIGALSGCSAEPVQYPPDQRPCSEALNALGVVSMARDRNGYGPQDPDGLVRHTLKEAKNVLSYRAGESRKYNAEAYNSAADRALATIDPLIDAYDREDPDTPYIEATDWSSRYSDYTNAESALKTECRVWITSGLQE